MRTAQEETLKRLFTSARRNRLEFLLEIIPSKVGPVDDDTVARLIRHTYEIGIHPDWWKLEPLTSARAWENACRAIEENDPHCRGVVVLGLDASETQLAASFAEATRHKLVKGFAVGRTIFGDAARDWFADRIDDETAIARMTENFTRLCGLWDQALARNDRETGA